MAWRASVRRAAIGAAALLLASHPLSARSGADETPAPRPVQIHFVDNFTQTFAVPPEFLWAELKRMYIDGNKYRDLGFAIEVLPPTPEAPLGGTIVSQGDGKTIDRRTALFTAIDDTRRFLALRVIYSTGIAAEVSYDVREAPGGSLVQLIVHAQQPMPATATPHDAAAVRREAGALTTFHYDQLVTMWAAEAQRVEALYRAGAAPAPR
ncbi:MAG: hypothetical protein HEQ21_07145 [Blastomonas sp.]|jgi:hypothetical protein|uniref:hypothetical protein n=1 Tax=Blastomonas sp. TaxID=1909299 RepID=UPI00258860A4|nr:hypothetical protein [Blastomonas sp.]MCO5792578.1 hypothetical protein [Blastomonas sp.]